MSWIQTYTGKKFDLLNPTPDMVDIEDIAHALSMLCRFTGHTAKFYSVAQHSVFVSDMLLHQGADNDTAFTGLMHDATEAYIGDLSTPLKTLLPEYRKIERRVWMAIAAKFELPIALPKEIKAADADALVCEKDSLLGYPPEPWSVQSSRVGMYAISPISAEVAHSSFLRTAKRLGLRVPRAIA